MQTTEMTQNEYELKIAKNRVSRDKFNQWFEAAWPSIIILTRTIQPKGTVTAKDFAREIAWKAWTAKLTPATQ